METKQFLRLTAVETKALDDESGAVESIFAVTGNEDHGGDTIQPGAFGDFISAAKSGLAKLPRLVWDHGVEKGLAALTGRVLDMEEIPPGDPRLPDRIAAKGLGGVYVKARYNLNTQPGREAYAHVKAGDVDEWSFMYEAPGKQFMRGGKRLLTKIFPVYEISNVLVGMNPETVTMAVKSAAETVDATATTAAAEIVGETTPSQVAAPAIPDGVSTKHGPAVEGIFAELKGVSLPVLQGAEAVHQDALNVACTAINQLIIQELAEGNPEYDCVSWLASCGASLIAWANQENIEYADPPAIAAADPPAASDYRSPSLLSDPLEDVESKDGEPSAVRIREALADLLRADLADITSEARRSLVQPSVHAPEHPVDGLPSFARFGARPRLRR